MKKDRPHWNKIASPIRRVVGDPPIYGFFWRQYQQPLAIVQCFAGQWAWRAPEFGVSAWRNAFPNMLDTAKARAADHVRPMMRERLKGQCANG